MTGYKTAIGGADTVFPFTSNIKILKATSLNGINGNEQGYSASNAIDGDTDTCYLCNSTSGPEIVLTLESESCIKEVRVLAARAGSSQSISSIVTVYGSKDNVNFKQIASGWCINYIDVNKNNIAFSAIPVNNTEYYRYIKLTKDGEYSGFYEIEIVGQLKSYLQIM